MLNNATFHLVIHLHGNKVQIFKILKWNLSTFLFFVIVNALLTCQYIRIHLVSLEMTVFSATKNLCNTNTFITTNLFFFARTNQIPKLVQWKKLGKSCNISLSTVIIGLAALLDLMSSIGLCVCLLLWRVAWMTIRFVEGERKELLFLVANLTRNLYKSWWHNLYFAFLVLHVLLRYNNSPKTDRGLSILVT